MDMTKEIMDFTQKLDGKPMESQAEQLEFENQLTNTNTTTAMATATTPSAATAAEANINTNATTAAAVAITTTSATSSKTETKQNSASTTPEPLMLKPIEELTSAFTASSPTSITMFAASAAAGAATTMTKTTTTPPPPTSTTTTTTTISSSLLSSSSTIEAAGATATGITHSIGISGDLTPPPRPLTSSEVLGLTDPDPDIHIELTQKKSRSLPVSPNPLLSAPPPMPHLAHMFGPTFATRSSHLPPPNIGLSKHSIKHNLAVSAMKAKASLHSAGNNAQNQQFCLRWNNYQTNLTNVFDELLQNESFVDVTLACDGQSIKAHKMVLSACSPYFQALFYDNPCQHPIIIMRDVRWQELKALMEFMYKGEINVSQDQINPLLKVAEMLKIRGLAEVGVGAHGMAAHPMVPEQRMTVYDDDEVEDLSDDDSDVVEHDDAVANADDLEGCQRPKRARLSDAARVPHKLPLDMNLTGMQRQRKRSRDGLLLEGGGELRAATPTTLRNDSQTTGSADDRQTPTGPSVPLAMTTSTIVRNPFASPNPTGLHSSGGSGGATAGVSLTPTNSTANMGYHTTSPLPSATNSGSLPSPGGSIGSAGGSGPERASATERSAAAHHMSAHGSHPHAPHHHAHHHAAQQLAAQHQLHAAAHSHAAMASALGASLAAAAAGAGAVPGSAAGSMIGGHHDDMEIKPEIAEMIREEERVFQ